MARTKARVRRLPVKTQCLPGWIVNREYGKKKNLSVQDKGDPTRAEDCKHNKKRTNSKNNKREKKI